MKEILQEKQDEDKYKLSKNTIKVLLIAAILLSITITAFAIPASREFITKSLFNHSSYSLVDKSDYTKVESLVLNYIPEDFIQTDEFVSEYYFDFSYENKEYHFSVNKYALNTKIDYDTEKYEHETIIINNSQGVFYRANEFDSGLIFNNNYYIFVISGNISKEEIIKIAQGLE